MYSVPVKKPTDFIFIVRTPNLTGIFCLFLLQSEINEVFEKFNMPAAEPIAQHPVHTTVRNNGSLAPVDSSSRSLSVVEGDNNLLPAAGERASSEKVSVALRGTPATTRRTSTPSVIMDSDSEARLAILPYPRAADCREDLVADWANSVMKECDELVIDVIDSRPTSLRVASPSTSAALPEEWAPPAKVPSRRGAFVVGNTVASGHSYADQDAVRSPMTLMAKRTAVPGSVRPENSDASPGDFRRIAVAPKPDKRVSYSFSSSFKHRAAGFFGYLLVADWLY